MFRLISLFFAIGAHSQFTLEIYEDDKCEGSSIVKIEADEHCCAEISDDNSEGGGKLGKTGLYLETDCSSGSVRIFSKGIDPALQKLQIRGQTTRDRNTKDPLDCSGLPMKEFPTGIHRLDTYSTSCKPGDEGTREHCLYSPPGTNQNTRRCHTATPGMENAAKCELNYCSEIVGGGPSLFITAGVFVNMCEPVFQANCDKWQNALVTGSSRISCRPTPTTRHLCDTTFKQMKQLVSNMR